MNIQQTLASLTALNAVAGHEQAAAQVVCDLLRPLVEEVHVDRFGNVHGLRRCANADAKTVLLDAHLDQIGFLVSAHEGDGFLRLAAVGGIDPRMLMGCEVDILTNPVRLGVVACMPPHTLSTADRNKALPLSDLLVDTGLLDAPSAIPIGTPVVLRGQLQPLGDAFVAGRSLDDRAGMVSILYALEQLKDVDLQVNLAVLFSVQEEVTTLGAMVGTHAVQPDYAIAVDVTHASSPDASGEFRAGGGVAIGMGPNTNRPLWQALISTCEQAEMPYQIEVMEGHTGTNAWEMQIVGTGVATAILSIPLRYMHTPIECASLSDVQAVGDLLYQFLRRCNGEVQL